MTKQEDPATCIEFQEWVNGKASHTLTIANVVCMGEAHLVEGRFVGDCNRAETAFNWCVDNAREGWSMGSYWNEHTQAYTFLVNFASEADMARAKVAWS